MSHKMIALDEPTRKFLGALRNFRRRIGKHQREIADDLQLDESTYQKHELGLSYPSLENLMRLAEYFGYDLSESVNHKVYYRTLQPENIKRSLRRYDLSYRELSEQTGYTIDCISNSIRMNPKCSVACLCAVLGVIRHEQEMESFRKENSQRRERRRRNDTTHAKEFLGNLEPSNGACRVTDNVSSARLPSVAGRSGRPDLKGDTRDDERGANKAPGRLYPDDA